MTIVNHLYHKKYQFYSYPSRFVLLLFCPIYEWESKWCFVDRMWIFPLSVSLASVTCIPPAVQLSPDALVFVHQVKHPLVLSLNFLLGFGTSFSLRIFPVLPIKDTCGVSSTSSSWVVSLWTTHFEFHLVRRSFLILN